MNKKIILVAGDPNSINSEIIYKTWKKLKKNIRKKIYLIGNYKLINEQLKKLNFKIKTIKVNDINIISENLKIIDIPIKFRNPFNVSLKNSSKYVIKSLNLAHKLSLDKKIKGLINCPINKKLIKKNKICGVTEFLALKSVTNNNSEVMMLYNKKLSVVPLTTHINLKNVSKKINKNLIITKIKTLDKYYKKIFNKKPKVAILGLNPHNSELEKESEEINKIVPAIVNLKKNGLNVHGPIVADTMFIKDYKKFDVIVGMYHDQVLIPFKTLFKFNAINITLGLDYIRVSPDHGTAIDIIKKKRANFISLFECVKFINNLN